MAVMSDATRPHVWGNTEAYEAYMGRWSRPAAHAFLAWLAPVAGQRWLDVGCGTGALTEAIVAAAGPSEILGIDPSADYLSAAKARIADSRVRFETGDARELPVADDAFDVVVSGLVLNHVPDPAKAAAEMVRVGRPGATVSAYVWDYAGAMQLVRTFWDAAIGLDPAAAEWDQGRHCSICQPESLAALLRAAGLGEVTVAAIDGSTTFRDFDDYWRPHVMAGAGVAPRYVATLGETQRARLRDRLQATLPIASDGSIPLIARAWAVRGTKASGVAFP